MTQCIVKRERKTKLCEKVYEFNMQVSLIHTFGNGVSVSSSEVVHHKENKLKHLVIVSKRSLNLLIAKTLLTARNAKAVSE